MRGGVTNAVRLTAAARRGVHKTAAAQVACAHQRRHRRRDGDGGAVAAGPVIGPGHPAWALLQQPLLQVTRQMEMLNVFLGFEQANRYALVDGEGRAVGFMAEEQSLAATLGRQLYRTHRPFRVHVLDAAGKPCLEIRRGFSLINSRITVSDAAGVVVGESQQEWHPWRRRYNLFTPGGSSSGSGSRSGFDQFARVDAPFLSWDFPLADAHGAALGGVFRGFAGIGTELLTDYGLYSLCLSRTALAQRADVGQPCGLPLAGREMGADERAVALAAAVSIDFDYFSRHSRLGGGIVDI